MANWKWAFTGGINYLINFNRMETISEGPDGQAVIEWAGGTCQLTLTKPSFKVLQNELEK